MAFLHLRDVRIAGIAAGVPRQVRNNIEASGLNFSSDYSPEEYVKSTGVLETHVSPTLCASDLCYYAAEKLIADLAWSKDEIQALVFVSQHPDYILPATSCLLQDRLGLSKECYATDCGLGCSGWVYGLSEICALMATGEIKKALLCVGDAKRRVAGWDNDPLFGWAGTVTALEYQQGAEGLMFHLGTDGSGYDAIFVPDGGARTPISPESFKYEDIDGRQYHRGMSRMKGMDVFSFGISTAPKSVKALAEHYGFNYLDSDYFVFHQANMKMNAVITKKLKLPEEKVPSCMYHYGNTSSASIPLTIVTQLQGQVQERKRFLCCGFGVGLSWGTVAFETENLVMPEVVLVDELE